MTASGAANQVNLQTSVGKAFASARVPHTSMAEFDIHFRIQWKAGIHHSQGLGGKQPINQP